MKATIRTAVLLVSMGLPAAGFAQGVCALSNAIVAAACLAQHDAGCRASGTALLTGSAMTGGRVFEVACAPVTAPAVGNDDCTPGQDCACDGVAGTGSGVIPGGVYHCAVGLLSDCYRAGGAMALSVSVSVSGETGTAWGRCTAG